MKNRIGTDYKFIRETREFNPEWDFTNKKTLEKWIKNKIKKPHKNRYGIDIILHKFGVLNNKYYWEYWIRLFKDGEIVEQVSSDEKLFNILEYDTKKWEVWRQPRNERLEIVETVRLIYREQNTIIEESEIIKEIEETKPEYNEDEITTLVELLADDDTEGNPFL
jgi:hypothetical protein